MSSHTPEQSHDIKYELVIISYTTETVKYMDAHTEAVHVSKLDSHKAANKYYLDVILSTAESVGCVDAHAKDVYSLWFRHN